jgi:2,4-dienoyl-CoA reductase-like NADH-dependent reductase (Old Yellow Enzyme family)/NADPH-dependent 2,4-dienoyl-CoA reductase/sulfur reductase-like enzyme
MIKRAFPRLSDEGFIGTLKIRNRFVMAPFATNYCNPDGSVTTRLLRHCEERTKGGVGLIIVEFAYIDNEGSKSLHSQIGAYDDQLIPGLSLLARVIQENGAKAGIQIVHAGLQRSLAHPVVAPSRVWKEYLGCHKGIFPQELTIEAIQDVVASFGQAAMRAKIAGFDMVEIHGAHGYLINQFLTPYTNRRNDMYGGSLENRMRFPLQVVRNVREVLGKDFALGIRINGADYLNGGVTLEEAKVFAKELEVAGVDVIHVSAGIHRYRSRMIEPMFLPMGNKIRLGEAIKSVVKIPIIASGSLGEPKLAEEVLETKKADFISMARPLIADPELLKRTFEGRVKEIRPCIRCNDGCLRTGTFARQAVKCTVNVEAGFEEWLDLSLVSQPQRVLVVGGGPGGMEAALTAAKKGHHVTLIEKRKALGGRLIEASVPAFKNDLKRLIEYYSEQLKKLHVEVVLEKEVRKEEIEENGYDAVILATGSMLAVPDVPGIHRENVSNCLDILQGQEIKEDEVIVVGGGMVGCEVALYLSENRPGKKVKVVEMLDEIGFGIEPLALEVVLEKLSEYGVECLKGLQMVEVLKNGVKCVDRKREVIFIEGKRIVLATGFKSNDILRREIYDLGIKIQSIGDCSGPRRIYEAIHEGNQAARCL